MKAFKAYDIRGVYNKDFNKNDVYKIGFFLPKLLNAKTVLVGRDVRKSSPEIFQFLCKGITDAGANVVDANLTTTPMIYFATAKYNFDASVMITASHNPAEYNGLKISGKEAKPIGYHNGLNQLENLIENEDIIPTTIKGEISNINIKDDYIKFLNKYSCDFSNLNLSIDCSNGMVGLLIKDILGKNPKYIYEELDGSFPNHEPNPLNPKNIKDLQKHVLENKSDLGIIFDGDADRVMFVDENASFISPDLMIAVIAHYFLQNNKNKELVIQDIRSSKAVGEYIAKIGGEMFTWKVGRAFAASKLKEIDGLFGGELAGHYYFRDFYFSDSGLMACLIILNVISEMKNNGVSVSSLIKKIKKYENSGEINFKIDNKQTVMNEIINHYINKQKPIAFYDFDGYRIEYKDWWINIRPSNTEPYLRFIAEANSSELLANIVLEVENIIISKGGKKS